jgi:hypothetical protein
LQGRLPDLCCEERSNLLSNFSLGHVSLGHTLCIATQLATLFTLSCFQ